jgi:hypothetical protein
LVNIFSQNPEKKTKNAGHDFFSILELQNCYLALRKNKSKKLWQAKET